MKLTDLKPAPGSKTRRKRVGRGGKWGKTCTRGSNGQNCRSGGGKGPGFEGGQTPWYKRLPKFRGFNNKFREENQLVSLDQLDRLEDFEEITPQVLHQAGIINDPDKPIKVLANGQINRAVTVRVTGFSKNAQKAIEAAGGKAEVI